MTETGRLFLVTGAPAAGKTTVGRALAEGLRKAVFIDGDTLQDMVVTGRVSLTDPPSVDAVEQLFLRYAAGLSLADVHRTAGFDAVIADDVLGTFLEDYLTIAAPQQLHVVVLDPSAEVIEQRAAQRDGAGFGSFGAADSPGAGLSDEVRAATQQVGLWIDTSRMDVAQTVTHILRNLPESIVDTTEFEDETAQA